MGNNKLIRSNISKGVFIPSTLDGIRSIREATVTIYLLQKNLGTFTIYISVQATIADLSYSFQLILSEVMYHDTKFMQYSHSRKKFAKLIIHILYHIMSLDNLNTTTEIIQKVIIILK